MTDREITVALAERVMGWRVTTNGPDGKLRFCKAHRSWMPEWKFDPLNRITDAMIIWDAMQQRPDPDGDHFAATLRSGVFGSCAAFHHPLASGPHDPDGFCWYEARAALPPRAICLAALAALPKEPTRA
jgi:hypothetical protein